MAWTQMEQSAAVLLKALCGTTVISLTIVPTHKVTVCTDICARVHWGASNLFNACATSAVAPHICLVRKLLVIVFCQVFCRRCCMTNDESLARNTCYLLVSLNFNVALPKSMIKALDALGHRKNFALLVQLVG